MCAISPVFPFQSANASRVPASPGGVVCPHAIALEVIGASEGIRVVAEAPSLAWEVLGRGACCRPRVARQDRADV
jgi:hypothetical protein